MYDGYLYLNGTEIVNHDRTMAYLRGRRANGEFFGGMLTPGSRIRNDCGCPDLTRLFCDLPPDAGYHDPITDNAPWNEPANPWWPYFAGVIVETVTGWDNPITRPIAQSTFGGTFGAPVVPARQLVYTGWIRALNCDGAQHGFQWLTEALSGSACDDPSQMGELLAFTNCPLPGALTGNDAQDLRQYGRRLVNVALIKGPTIIGRSGVCCNNGCGCANLKVTWTLASETPEVFGEAFIFDENRSFDFTTLQCPEFTTVCTDCGDADQLVLEREIERAHVSLLINSDGTWCGDFDTMPTGVIFDPIAVSDLPSDQCVRPIQIHENGTWQPLGWPISEYPACGCTLTIASLVYTDPITTPAKAPAEVTREIVVNLTNGTWTPIRWNNIFEFPIETAKFVVVELTYGDYHDVVPTAGTPPYQDPPSPHAYGTSTTEDQCLINVNRDGTWSPIGWSVSNPILPPKYCTITVSQPSYSPPAVPPIGAKTHAGVRADCLITLDPNGTWSGPPLPPPDYCTLKVATPGPCCVGNETPLPIAINGDGTWSSLGWQVERGTFIPPSHVLTIPGQDTSLQTVQYTVTESTGFIPDCGTQPIIVPPPPPLEDCYCDPWGSATICYSIYNPFTWSDATAIMQIDSGSTPLRNFRLLLITAPDDTGVCPCDIVNDPVLACAEPCAVVEIPQLPEGAVIYIDGRTRTVNAIFKGHVEVTSPAPEVSRSTSSRCRPAPTCA
jgi:hypothetical protein